MLPPSHNPKAAESATRYEEDPPNLKRIERHAQEDVEDV
jgi:hypothetical protein